MSFWVAGATAAVGIGSAISDHKSAKKSIQTAEKQRDDSLAFIREQLANSRADLFHFFPQAQQSRQQGNTAALNAMQTAFPEALNAFQGGNVAAQQVLLQGLPQANNALLGKAPDLSGLQAQRLPVNTQALQGMFTPEALKFGGY